MPIADRPTPQPGVRRARAAVAVLFLTNGALFANLVPRFPEIKADLALSNAAYGLTIAAFPAASLLAGPVAGVALRRLGSAQVAVLGTLVIGAGVLLAGTAPSVVVLGAALALAGAADAIADVAQNAHGLRVQRAYGRSIINSFHALWSIGAVLGGLMAAAAIGLDLARGVHLAGVAVVLGLLAAVALPFRLPGPDRPTDTTDDAPGAGPAAPVGPSAHVLLVVAALVGIAVAGSLVEDAGSTWAAVYLSGDLGAPVALAAVGYVALVGGQTVGRLIGDRLVDRFGQRAVARGGGVVAALGMGLALAVPTVPGTIAGFAAAGLGIATLVPAAMHEADELPGLRPGTGLTAVSWLMRLGFLLSPPVVGLVADAAGLRVGLLVVPLAGLAVVLLAGVLPRRR